MNEMITSSLKNDVTAIILRFSIKVIHHDWRGTAVGKFGYVMGYMMVCIFSFNDIFLQNATFAIQGYVNYLFKLI